jgi:esterase/lipase
MEEKEKVVRSSSDLKNRSEKMGEALGAARSSNSFRMFKDQEMDWVFKRTLEPMIEKAAEIGECLYAARLLDETDGESWIRTWEDLGARVERQADEALKKKQKIAARYGYWRACNYYRTAEYGTSPFNPRHFEIWHRSVNSFRKSCNLFNPPLQYVEIPYQGKFMPGYFWRPYDTDTKRPTLILVGGSDSSGEEVVYLTGPSTIRNGYNFFTFEYPGHRGCVHLHPELIKRAYYEDAFKTAIDFLQNLKGVDERIALSGWSYGGYVVSQVAIHEKRLKAVIPDSPIIDLNGVCEKFYGAVLSRLKGLSETEAHKLFHDMLMGYPVKKAFVEYQLWTWGMKGKTLLDYMKSDVARQSVLTSDIHKITCPALALVGEGEGSIMIEQAREFMNGISSVTKKLHIFNLKDDGSNDHCQLDNTTRGLEVIFDWLNEEVFHYRPELICCP